MRHAGAIDLHQDAFLEIELGAKVKDPFESTRQSAAVGQAGDILKSVVAVEFVPDLGGQEIATLRISAGAHPEKEANFSGKSQTFEKLGEKEGDALVIVGDGHSLDEMIDGIPHSHRKKGEALHQEVGLETGITGKEFISPVTPQNGFDLGGGQA
jgi:hypothetical protein